MKKNEHIVYMITCFTNIINGIKGYNRKITDGKLISKMRRSLLEYWKGNIIDINKYLLKELHGTLMMLQPKFF